MRWPIASANLSSNWRPNMARQCVELAPLSERALAMLRKRVERQQSFDGDIYPESAIPADLDYLAPGRRYGRYHEVIKRREVRRAGIPAWFNPQELPGQAGIISRDGIRC